MKILIISDSYKDSLSSIEVGNSLRKGILSFAHHDVDVLPISDGGEGTAELFISQFNAKKIFVKAKDPLFRDKQAFYALFNSKAIIEMANISGLQLISPKDRNPMNTTTFGTGQLIKDALNKGIRDFLITIGGSATCDGGMGMAAALGYIFKDVKGSELLPVGRNMVKVDSIDSSKVDSRIFDSNFIVACDVDNPFYGPEGASFIYSRQKGANDEEILFLDKGLRNLSSIIKRDLKKDISTIAGSGAAGGLGGGLIAFLNATLKSGIETIMNILNLKERIPLYDLIITGEGKIDAQTLNGKVVSGITKMAKINDKKIIVVAANVAEDAYSLYDLGVDLILSIQQRPISLEESIKSSQKLLEITGERISRMISLFS